jgi:hypothetical protein
MVPLPLLLPLPLPLLLCLILPCPGLGAITSSEDPARGQTMTLYTLH